MRKERLPPGPRGFPGIGSLVGFHRDPNGFLQNLAARYGDVASFRAGRHTYVLVNDPSTIERILVTDARRFVKGRLVERAKRVMGEGLITSSGATHERHRRLVQPAFASEYLTRYANEMISSAAQCAAGWQAGTPRWVDRDMRDLTLTVITRVLFDATPDDTQRLRECLRTLSRWIPLLLGPSSLRRLPGLPRIEHGLARLNATVDRLVSAARQGSCPGAGLLSVLASAQDIGGHRMTTSEIRDEAVTAFLAGYETTSVALAWVWHLLGSHPEVERRVQAEIDDVLKYRRPVPRDVDALAYLGAVVHETLRLYPPVGRMGRRPADDYPVGPYVVPAGAVIFVSPFVTHRDPRFFHRPLHFMPERWLPPRPGRNRPFVYFPFGGGNRRCVGGRFAHTMIVLTVATIAQQWRLDHYGWRRVRRGRMLTLRPRPGVRVVPRPRPTSGRGGASG